MKLHTMKPNTDRPAGWRVALALLLTCLLFAPGSRAADANPPERMTYQGFLTDVNGVALGETAPRNYTAIFRVYPVATGGAPSWTEQQTITVDKGYFSVLLGEGSAVGSEARPALSSVFTGTTASDRYIGITIKGPSTVGTADVEILPRLQLMASPYAFLATKANAVANALGANLITTSGTSVGIGTITPNYQLSFGNNLANTKLALYDAGVGTAYGMGIQGSQFRLHVGGSGDRFTFLNSAAGAELMNIHGNGNVSVVGNLGYGGQLSRLDVAESGTAVVRVADFTMGAAGRRGSPGRALVDLGPQLAVNYGPDWGSTLLGGNVGIGTSSPASLLDIGPGPHWRPLTVRGSMGTDAVVVGNYEGRATIAGHNSALNAWASLSLGHGDVLIPANLGIGTTSPGAKLHINGGARIEGGNTLEFGGGVAGKEANAGKVGYQTFTSGALDIVGAGPPNTERKVMLWDRLGIGIQNPVAPLHVKKANPAMGHWIRKSGRDDAYGVYLGNGGVTHYDGTSPHTGNYETINFGVLSAVMEGEIICRGIWFGDGYSYSDARSKNVLGSSDSAHDLSLLRDLKVRDFTWIDRTVDNHRPQKKLVAQEVEQVIPQAVQRLPQPTAIPNVYQVAEKVGFNAERKELRVTVSKAHEFKVGDSVDLCTDDAPLNNVKVTAVPSEREFAISYDHAPKSVFVYGKYVTDYRSVDYNAIAMLNVSATQELARQVDALKQSQARIAELEQKAARVDTLEREVAQLKKLVASLAQGQVEQRNPVRTVAAADH